MSDHEDAPEGAGEEEVVDETVEAPDSEAADPEALDSEAAQPETDPTDVDGPVQGAEGDAGDDTDQASEEVPEGGTSGAAQDAAADESGEEEALGDAEAVDRTVLEALLFASEVPLSPARLKSVLGRRTKPADIRAALEAIREDLDERGTGFMLAAVAGGYQFRTRPEHAETIRRMRAERPARLSRPALETLVVVAYRQPVTRAEIEDIRRVDTGAVLRTLLERQLVRIVGRKDVPGRPVLYGTTKDFLEVFGFKSLKDLPTLKEIKDVAEEMGQAIDLPDDLLDPKTADEALDGADGIGLDGESTGADEAEGELDGGTPEPAGDEGEDRGEPAADAEQAADADDLAEVEEAADADDEGEAVAAAGPEHVEEDEPDERS